MREDFRQNCYSVIRQLFPVYSGNPEYIIDFVVSNNTHLSNLLNELQSGESFLLLIHAFAGQIGSAIRLLLLRRTERLPIISVAENSPQVFGERLTNAGTNFNDETTTSTPSDIYFSTAQVEKTNKEQQKKRTASSHAIDDEETELQEESERTNSSTCDPPLLP